MTLKTLAQNTTAIRHNISVKLNAHNTHNNFHFTTTIKITLRQRADRYRLGWKLVEVTSTLIAPDYDAIDSNELSADPTFSATA